MTDSAQARATRQRALLVFLLFLHTVNTYLDRVCISAAKGSMQHDIPGLDDQMMGYAFGIFAIGYALFQIPAGWFSDRAGPRLALTLVVVIWSIFTAWTGFVTTAIMLLVVRFLFGVGEAGAYPGATRALYSWLPASERGLGQGIFHAGARVGAAVSLVLMPWIIGIIGWRMTFMANAVFGICWATVWWFWFRNRPEEHRWTNEAEVEHIQRGLQETKATAQTSIPFVQLVTSANVLLAMFQYAASNVTFFLSITWLRPYMVDKWGQTAANLSAIPLLVGAMALWMSGWLVTRLHRHGWPVMSRRLPAMVGFALGATGLMLCTSELGNGSAGWFVTFLSIGIFGVEMTLSPSWSFCMDIGGSRSGAVSGSMNMVGNFGAAMSAVAFPYCVAHVTLPVVAPVVGTANSYFALAAAFNLAAMIAWLFMNPLRKLNENLSSTALKVRLGLFAVMIVVIVLAVIKIRLF